MKNVAIGILTIISVGSLIFGYNQKSELDSVTATCVAEKQALEKLAQQQQQQAEEFQKMAQMAQQEAMIQKTICEEQLKSLKSK